MWRRYGDAAYALLVLVVFSVEAVALALLMWAFIGKRFGLGPDILGLHVALAGSVALTALAVLTVTGYTLAYQAISSARGRKNAAAKARWGRRWVEVAFGTSPVPSAPWPRAASEALIDLHEELHGESRDRLALLLRNSAVIEDLLDEAARGGHRRGRHLARRLDALDLLSRIGAPVGFDRLAALTRDPALAVRFLAVRTLARATGGLSDDAARDQAAALIVEVFADEDVPLGAVEEAMLLLGPAAPSALRGLLAQSRRPRLVPLALDAVGRLKEAGLIDDVVTCLDAVDPEVRAAALRALAQVGLVPERAYAAARAACAAPEASVRSQAARAAALLPSADAVRALEALVADPSWWVRRSAAWAMVRVGPDGVAMLREMAREGADQYGREIAIQVLVGSGHLGAEPGLVMSEMT